MIDIDFKLQSTQKWSEASLDCYNRCCRCEGCVNYNLLWADKEKNECQMKNVVIALIKRFGVPQVDDEI